MSVIERDHEAKNLTAKEGEDKIDGVSSYKFRHRDYSDDSGNKTG